MSGRASPLVIVTRRAVPGRRKGFERWLAELEAAARRAPGFVALHVTEPDDTAPDEWAVTYRFRTVDELEAWLRSPERASTLEAGADLVVGPPREQRLALDDDADAVTAVSSVRVPAEAREAYRAAHDRAASVMASFPGFIRSELFEPVPGVQEDTVVALSWATRADLDRWLHSDARAEALAELDALSTSDRTLNVVGGFAGWFPGPGDDVPGVRRWKQALVVLLALYPTALVLGVVRELLYPDLAAPLATLVGNALGVAVLTWLLMPPLTRALDGWLRR